MQRTPAVANYPRRNRGWLPTTRCPSPDLFSDDLTTRTPTPFRERARAPSSLGFQPCAGFDLRTRNDRGLASPWTQDKACLNTELGGRSSCGVTAARSATELVQFLPALHFGANQDYLGTFIVPETTENRRSECVRAVCGDTNLNGSSRLASLSSYDCDQSAHASCLRTSASRWPATKNLVQVL